MFDLEWVGFQLKHNNELRRIIKELRSSFSGRTDEGAIKIIAMCDRTERDMNKDEQEDSIKITNFLRQFMDEGIIRDCYEEI